MPSVRLGKELHVQTPNAAGTLAQVSQVFAAKGINILDLCSYENQNRAEFWIVTDNNSQATPDLKNLGFTVEEKDVLLVEMENRPGTLAPVAKLISDSNINIHSCYFTTTPQTKMSLCVFSTTNDQKAMQVIQQGATRKAA